MIYGYSVNFNVKVLLQTVIMTSLCALLYIMSFRSMRHEIIKTYKCQKLSIKCEKHVFTWQNQRDKAGAKRRLAPPEFSMV